MKRVNNIYHKICDIDNIMMFELSQVNGYTGMGVSIIIMGLGLYMIINIRKCLED